jgi:hypothetical protein
MNIVEYTKSLENVVERNNLNDIASVLKNEYAIPKSDELQKALEELKNEGRVLKIGIIGRVKAGKSSLLNSLIFDGEDILPKAATPMTAALTILEYSEKPKAEIDFFSQADIDDIKQEYDDYCSYLKNLEEEKYQYLKNKEDKKYSTLIKEIKKDGMKNIRKTNLKKKSDSELREIARRQAEREAKKNEKLYSSYDQYRRILDSRIKLENVNKISTIEADNNRDLNIKLKDFVSADGKYMPFTKLVTLKLNSERLKELQVIDTPGINDPVTSREERTKELLKYCDAVFIVSPAGQFLSSEDINLLDRVRKKEGVHEIHLIASQIDLQLFGSEKDKGQGVLPIVLENVLDRLSNHVKNIFKDDKDLINTDSLNKLTENDVLYSSGISYSILKKYDNKNLFDQNESHVWKLLTSQYSDFFSTKERAIPNLEKLSNVKKILELLDEIKNNKDEIIKQKEENFISSKSNAIKDYNKALISYMQEKIDRLKTTDLDEIQNKKKKLERITYNASISLNSEYEDIIRALELELKGELKNRVKLYFKKAKQDIDDSEGEKVETWTTGLLIWKKTHSRTYTTIKAGFARNLLEDLTDDIERVIDEDAKNYMLNWKKKLYKNIVSLLRKEASDENLDIPLITQAIRKVLNSIKYPDIVYSGTLPKELRVSGTLEGYRAEKFIANAQNYLNDLRNRVNKDINSYINNVIKVLNKIDMADEIFGNYKKEIEELKLAIENKELTLEKYNMIKEDLENIYG